jgi:hypothetical protein
MEEDAGGEDEDERLFWEAPLGHWVRYSLFR